MVYKIDPEHDRQYIEEFRRKPIGAHSPGLMRLLTVMRQDPSGFQVILVCRKPFAEWVLATMPPKRADPIVIEDRGRFSPAGRRPNGRSFGGDGANSPARRSTQPFGD